MKIKSLVLFAVFGLLLGLFPSQSKAQIFVGPLPALLGPKNQAQVNAVANQLFGDGSDTAAVNAWMGWLLSGNPMAPAPAQNVIPLDLSLVLQKYYTTSDHLSDAEWAMVDAFEHTVQNAWDFGIPVDARSVWDVISVQGDVSGNLGDIVMISDMDTGDVGYDFDWPSFAPFLQQCEY